MISVEGHPTEKEQEEKYKERLRQYSRIDGNCNPKVLEELRDKYLDSVRLINEVIREYD